MKTAKIVVLFLVVILLDLYAFEPVNDKNWRTHPEILKIRKLYDEINKMDKDEKLKWEVKDCDKDGGSYVTTLACIYIDKEGLVRKYDVSKDFGDVGGRTEYYYDQKGVLRFVFLKGIILPEGEIEDRIYFNEKGDQIYINHKNHKPDSNVEDEIIMDPKEHYENLCN